MAEERGRWLVRRAEEIAREMGVLLVTFAPLDAGLEFGHGNPSGATIALEFLIGGALLLALSILLEWRYERRHE